MSETNLTNPEQYCLGLLAEESGEICQLVGKAMRFGVDTPGRLGPDGKVVEDATPRALLEEECGDILAAVHFAMLHGLLGWRV